MASRAEIELEAVTTGIMRVLPADTAIFVLVKNLRPGVRLSTMCDGPNDADTDLSEETCAELYERLSDRRPELRQREKELLTAFGIA